MSTPGLLRLDKRSRTLAAGGRLCQLWDIFRLDSMGSRYSRQNSLCEAQEKQRAQSRIWSPIKQLMFKEGQDIAKMLSRDARPSFGIQVDHLILSFNQMIVLGEAEFSEKASVQSVRAVSRLLL
jgi:hypothetical protein